MYKVVSKLLIAHCYNFYGKNQVQFAANTENVCQTVIFVNHVCQTFVQCGPGLKWIIENYCSILSCKIWNILNILIHEDTAKYNVFSLY